MGPSQQLAGSDLACGTQARQAPRPILCLRSEWQMPEVGHARIWYVPTEQPFKELSEAAHCSAPSPCRSPQPAARSWPCLAWRRARMVRGTGRAWHRTDQAIRGFRGPLRSHPIFDLLQNIKLPFILPASRVTRLAASLQSLPHCLTPH